VKRKEIPGGYRDFSSLELNELKGNCAKEQTLRMGTVDLVELEFRLKKNNRGNDERQHENRRNDTTQGCISRFRRRKPLRNGHAPHRKKFVDMKNKRNWIARL